MCMSGAFALHTRAPYLALRAREPSLVSGKVAQMHKDKLIEVIEQAFTWMVGIILGQASCSIHSGKEH